MGMDDDGPQIAGFYVVNERVSVRIKVPLFVRCFHMEVSPSTKWWDE